MVTAVAPQQGLPILPFIPNLLRFTMLVFFSASWPFLFLDLLTNISSKAL
jgi:hypothetical protein